jgi:formylglycine-generating enzyme
VDAPTTVGVCWVAGSTFRMGDDNAYPEESPAHTVTVSGFYIDEYPVTNSSCAAFVKANGHCTVAERPLDPADYPGADPSLLTPGSSVFFMPTRCRSTLPAKLPS